MQPTADEPVREWTVYRFDMDDQGVPMMIPVVVVKARHAEAAIIEGKMHNVKAPIIGRFNATEWAWWQDYFRARERAKRKAKPEPRQRLALHPYNMGTIRANAREVQP